MFTRLYVLNINLTTREDVNTVILKIQLWNHYMSFSGRFTKNGPMDISGSLSL